MVLYHRLCSGDIIGSTEAVPANDILAVPAHAEPIAHELHTSGAGKGSEVSPCRLLQDELVCPPARGGEWVKYISQSSILGATIGATKCQAIHNNKLLHIVKLCLRLTPPQKIVPHSPAQYRTTEISRINPGMSVRGCLLCPLTAGSCTGGGIPPCLLWPHRFGKRNVTEEYRDARRSQANKQRREPGTGGTFAPQGAAKE